MRTPIAAAVLALAACASVPVDERLLALQSDGQVAASTQPCGAAPRPLPLPLPGATASGKADALDGNALRILSWNLHKGEDEGWEADLARFAAESDLLLLQEAVLIPPTRRVIEGAGHHWLMAGAFSFGGSERGVLVAAKALPLEGCTLRSFEPLFMLPKSAIVARYRLAGRAQPVAVANLHGINFTLGLGRFGEQLEAVAAELTRHDGPIVFAGDFNTWSQERHELLLRVASRLGLRSVEVAPDGRRRTFGLHLDHLFVRGFTTLRAHAPEVKSSDHNPILVTLVAH